MQYGVRPLPSDFRQKRSDPVLTSPGSAEVLLSEGVAPGADVAVASAAVTHDQGPGALTSIELPPAIEAFAFVVVGLPLDGEIVPGQDTLPSAGGNFQGVDLVAPLDEKGDGLELGRLGLPFG